MAAEASPVWKARAPEEAPGGRHALREGQRNARREPSMSQHPIPPTRCPRCPNKGLSQLFEDLESLRAHLRAVHGSEALSELNDWLTGLESEPPMEDLAWVERVPPEVEEALRPLPRALLEALREELRNERSHG